MDNQEIILETPKKRSIWKKALLVFFILFLMFGSFQAGIYTAKKSEFSKKFITQETVFIGNVLNKYSGAKAGELGQDVDFSLFWDVWDTLKQSYVDKDSLNDKKMFYGALHGLVASVGDPYTVFMDPKVAESFNEDLTGTFEGIGAEIGMKNELLTIIAPLPDMPAEKAGLKAGDNVVTINGESTTGLSVDEAVSKIRGPKGTEVTLTIYRQGFDNVKEYKLMRDKIIVKSVRTNFRDDKVFVIQITNFNDDTETLFNDAVKEAISKNPAGLVIDLRNNPGGYLDTAIEVASEWAEDGVIVTEKYSEEKKIEHLARGRARLKDMPTVVLVNQGSASASEIVSGALQDDKLAVIVGMKTFGKGSVQTLTNLKDTSSLKITVAKWLTPKGRSINDEGIMPDVVVDLTKEDYEKNLDPQMDKAVDILKKGKPEFEKIYASSTKADEIKK